MVVDDESLARQRMISLLNECAKRLSENEWSFAGEAANGSSALELIHDLRPDVVFLDIQMPGLQGFDVVELLSIPRPHIVFVTAYDEYALQAFDVHALDYLTKPVRAERLQRSMERISQLHYRQQQTGALDALRSERAALPLERLSVRDNDKIRVLAVNEIERIEAEDKIVHVFSKGKAYRTDFRLDELESRLHTSHFIRIHRSHIVRIDAVREIIPWFSGSYCVKLDDGTQLPVARRRASHMKHLLGKI